MPSGWTTSGIDWSNIRNNRTEDVVYHLHKALTERFTKYRIASSGGFNIRGSSFDSGTPVYSFDSKIRTETAMREMREILACLYATDDTYISNDSLFIGTRCLFDPNYIPNNTPAFSSTFASNPSDSRNSSNQRVDFANYLGGLTPLDYSQGGNLETLVGRDLSFIRDLSFNDRIRIEYLQTIYDILQLKQNCLCNTTNILTGIHGDVYSLGAGTGTNNGYIFSGETENYISYATNMNSDINATINDMYSSSPALGNIVFSSNSFGFIYLSGGSNQTTAFQGRQAIALTPFLKTKVKNGDISLSDIKMKTYIVDFNGRPAPPENQFDPIPYDIFPISGYGNGGVWYTEDNTFLQDNQGNYYYHVDDKKITSGINTLPTDSVSRQGSVVLANINTMNIDSIPNLTEYYIEDN